jgi:glyoxalase family protein
MKHSPMGIHHISVLGGDGQRTADFYSKVLGLRFIMKTVNQDDPSMHHLFFVNDAVHTGSSITFFPIPAAVQGKPGSGEATTVSFAVPSDSPEYWAERFGKYGVDFNGPFIRFRKPVYSFSDPDLLNLELVFDENVDPIPVWKGGPVPPEYGIRGFYGTTLRITETVDTATLLEDLLGFNKSDESENRTLYETGNPVGGTVILEKIENKAGRTGRGIVHHIAFRAKDDEEQIRMRQEIENRGLQPTEIKDRAFFRSVYFRSPGGVLFEIATDGPGYASVQSAEDLGKILYLPAWLESRREAIEKRLPEIQT